MYALKFEENFNASYAKNSDFSKNDFSRSNCFNAINAEGCMKGIAESINDNYKPSEDIFAETDDQLADQITTLAGQINAANYRFLKLIAEFDRRNAWAGFGIRSCAYWLSWKCGISLNPAREKIRTARALEGLPAINAAFEKGELSFSKVRAMTRIATVENEDYLLNIAEYGTAQHVEVLVKSYRKVSRIADTAEDFNPVEATECKKSALGETQYELRQQEREQENRSVSCYQDDDGMWIIKAKLPAEEGGLVAKVLKELGDRIADKKYARAEDNNAVDSPQNSAKSVSAETLLLSSESQSESESQSQLQYQNYQQEERLTFPQRRADALIAITEHYLASSNDSSETDLKLSSLKAAERCQLVLHVRAGSLNPAVGNDVNLDVSLNASLDGRWLLPNAARRLACDAGLLVVEEDDVGNVLDIGRKTRIIPPAMARALAIRDGGCQFPGCCEARYTEGHHIKHWADGGETKLDNLVTLCRYHHRELHKGAFFLSLKPASINTKDDKPVRFVERLCFSKVDRYFDAPFNRSDNFVIAANPAKFTCTCCDFSELEKTLPRTINEKTPVTKWLGESMDVGITVDGLLSAGKSEEHELN